MIRDFTIIMIWGVIIGTYSTIYIATPVLYYLNIRPHSSEPEPAKAEAAARPKAKAKVSAA